MLKICLTAVVAIVFACIVIKAILQAGFNIRNEKICKVLEINQSSSSDEQNSGVTKQEIISLVLLALAFRILTFVIYYFYLSSQSVKLMNLNDYLENWIRWDSNNYIAIARDGYANSLVDGRPLFLVFFPLYSYILKPLFAIFQDYRVAGLVISWCSYIIGSIYLYRLVVIDYGKKIAWNTVIFLSIFPFGFFLGGIMTEGLFFCVSVLTLYMIRKHRFGLAAIFGILGALTRMHGLLLMIPFVIEWMIYYQPIQLIKEKKWKELFRVVYAKLSFVLLIPFGTLYYLYINWKVTGNAFQFTIFQKEHWGQSYSFFINTIKYIKRYMLEGDHSMDTKLSVWYPEFILFFLALILLIIGFRKIRITYISYFFIYFIITFSVSWLLSGGRYMSCAVPMFIIIGYFTEKNKIVKYLCMSVFIVFYLFYLFAYASRWEVM